MARPTIRYRPGELRVLEGAPEPGLSPRELVVFELEGGLDARPVSLMPAAVAAAHGPLPSAQFLRRATPADLAQYEAKSEAELEAHQVVAERVRAHGLPMRLVDSLYTLDQARLTVCFTSDHRVDFRGLLRDLHGLFRRTRIQLRHLGHREEAQLHSGVGPCGKELCCSTFLKAFAPINIKLARDQDLNLAPAKLSGACGRLKCCLAFEVEAYRSAKEGLPRAGTRVLTAHGEGRVKELRIFEERVRVELDDGRLVEVGKGEANPLAEAHPGGAWPPPAGEATAHQGPRPGPARPQGEGKGEGEPPA